MGETSLVLLTEAGIRVQTQVTLYMPTSAINKADPQPKDGSHAATPGCSTSKEQNPNHIPYLEEYKYPGEHKITGSLKGQTAAASEAVTLLNFVNP